MRKQNLSLRGSEWIRSNVTVLFLGTYSVRREG